MSQVQIKRILFANVSGFLVFKGSSAILIDTGHKFSVDAFSNTMQKMSFLPENIKLIILTHTHFDHAGGAKEIQEITGAPIAVHTSEADFLRAGKTPFPRGTRWKGKLMKFLGDRLFRRRASYPSLVPDILIDDLMELSVYGIEGKVLHTPGHTSGSLSVILDNGKAFVGDNVLGIINKEHFPPFANDEIDVLKSWEKYINLGISEVYPAHGESVPIESLIEELPAAKMKYRQHIKGDN